MKAYTKLLEEYIGKHQAGVLSELEEEDYLDRIDELWHNMSQAEQDMAGAEFRAMNRKRDMAYIGGTAAIWAIGFFLSYMAYLWTVAKPGRVLEGVMVNLFIVCACWIVDQGRVDPADYDPKA